MKAIGQIADVARQIIKGGGSIGRAVVKNPVEGFFILLPILLFVVAAPVWIGVSRLNVLATAVWFVIAMSFLTIRGWGMGAILAKDSSGLGQTWLVPSCLS